MPDGSTIQGKNVYVVSAGFATHTNGTGRIEGYISPHGDGTAVLSCVVPADGAELVSATFTVISIGVGGGTQQWSISDGTNVLATRAALIDTTAAGTVSELTVGTATNGKAIATTAGSRLTITNTSVGTSTQGSTGIFNLVWAL
jgi:hypothetical protein